MESIADWFGAQSNGVLAFWVFTVFFVLVMAAGMIAGLMRKYRSRD